MSISRDEAKLVARETVDEVFDRFGVNLSDPESVARFRKNLDFMDKQRTGAEEWGRFVRKALTGGVIGGFLYVVWWGIKAAFNQ